MTINKKAQEYSDMSYDEDFEVDDHLYIDDYYADDSDLEVSNDSDDEELVAVNFDIPDDLIFSLPDVPGAPHAEAIVLDVDDEGDIEVKDGDNVEVEHDPWDWQSGGLKNFLMWLKGMTDNVPKHSGYDVAGLERAISYFELLLKEVSKAMRQDFKAEIDSSKAEEARDVIEKGIERMIDRLEKLKSAKHKRYAKKSKSWAETSGLVKSAQKMPTVSDIVITVPLFISRIVRVLINGTVSGGHDIEDMYEKLVKEYELSKREEAEVQQLLADMGYPVYQDRGLPPGEQVDRSRSDNFDWAANYNA